MVRPAQTPAPPLSLAPVIAAVTERLGVIPTFPAPGPRKALQAWVAFTPTNAVYLADTERVRRRLPVEARRLQWARDHGIPVPAVVELAPDWLITTRVPQGEPAGDDYVSSVIDVARRIAACPPPPSDLLVGSRDRRAPRGSRPLRLARMVASPLPPHVFLSARRAAASLPADTLAHGDFIPSNVPFDDGAKTVNLVDWEMFGYAPATTDLLVLWSHLSRADDRAAILDAVLSDAEDRSAVAALHRWIAVRSLADVVRMPRGLWDRERVERLRERVDEAITNAARWQQS